MSAPLVIEFDKDTQGNIALMSTAPERALAAIGRGMDKANELTIGDISARRMTGRGPYPVAEGKLGVVTNRLRSSLRASSSQIDGTTVTSAIGSNVVYAGVHEFGAVITRRPRAGVVRLRTNKRGELLRQVGYGHLAVFANNSHKLAKEVKFNAKGYTITIPARAPIGHGIADNTATYDREINAELRKAWEGR